MFYIYSKYVSVIAIAVYTCIPVHVRNLKDLIHVHVRLIGESFNSKNKLTCFTIIPLRFELNQRIRKSWS